MDILKRAADLLQNSAEEFESPDGLSICVGVDAWNEFFEVLDSKLERAQSEPVAAQCKLSCESVWRPCSVEHHNYVLSCPDEYPGYETRLLYTAPQPSSPPGWKLVPVEPTSKMIVAGAEADPQFFTHAKFVYRAMLAAEPEQEGGAA
ncbi:hypothetical protein [Laribacter hongkongensis]|uniref:hypothetical protein n=1 Tax=Laribacter hongkongensis TaxID=168471 RepID=UPI001EFECCCA|nr:hypothetical protein [Laribacter hongkongensis]MCG9081259.1 hypothetical protein [Laribacter hongkongensis]